MTPPKTVPEEDVKKDTDPPPTPPVKCVKKFTVKPVMIIKKCVPPVSMDGDYGPLPLPEKKPLKTPNVNNVKLDA